MNAAIFLKDKTGSEKPVFVENFTFDIDKDKLETVRAHLIALESGYCEGEKPQIGMQEVKNPKTGNMLKTMYAECEADFFYIAYLGVKVNRVGLVNTINP